MKLLRLLFLLLLIPSVAFGWGTGNEAYQSADTESNTGYCSGSEPFCYDGIEEDQITWDTTTGTEDCDGYDADGDWCDYDTNVPSGTGYSDIHSVGIYGDGGSYYLEYEMASSYSEYYIEGWLYFDEDNTSNEVIEVSQSDNTVDLRLITRSGSEARVYTDGLASYIETASGVFTSTLTWYHYGLYVKQEVTPGTSGDGIVRLWVNTDGGVFDVADIVLNSSSEDTGTMASQKIKVQGPGSGDALFHALIKLTSGNPSWSYE